jgi:hypothetical protein
VVIISVAIGIGLGRGLAADLLEAPGLLSMMNVVPRCFCSSSVTIR